MQLPAGNENTIGRKELAKGSVQAVHLATDIFPVVTSLPVVNVVDGQVVFYQAAAGVQWMLRYNADSTSSYKWEFVGGPPLYSAVATLEGTASVTYAALATAGPTVTLPLAGDYDISMGAMAFPGATAIAYMSYDIGGTGAVDGDAARLHVNATQASIMRHQRKTGLTAVALTSKYRTTAGTSQWQERWMLVSPIRVG